MEKLSSPQAQDSVFAEIAAILPRLAGRRYDAGDYSCEVSRACAHATCSRSVNCEKTLGGLR